MVALQLKESPDRLEEICAGGGLVRSVLLLELHGALE
jgi:hypothetical protein